MYYPEQIGAYKNILGDPDQYSTTPTNFKLNQTDFLLDEDIESSVGEESRITSMQLRSDESFLSPPNHRKQYSEGRLNTYTPGSLKPSGFKVNDISTTAAAFPQIPKDYVGNVNSIGDILDQVHAQGSYSDMDHSAVASMAPPVNSGLSIRVQGTYRQKKANDERNKLLLDSIGLHTIKTPSHVSNGAVINSDLVSDPFYPYKPASLSDINLMASKQFRFAPFVHHTKVKPVKVTAQLSEAEAVYNQILAASANRQKQQLDISRKEQTDHKPFSLMLDVYPVHDNEAPTSTKQPLPIPFKRPLPPPMDVNSLNNNLQYDQSYYNLIKFPQLQPYRTPNMHPYYDDMYFRRYMTLRQNPWWYRAQAHLTPQQQQQSSERHEQQSTQSVENQPSQITVHLNLFPSRKSKAPKSKVTSVEILGRSGEESSHLFTPNIVHSEEETMRRNGSIGIPHLVHFPPSPLVLAENVTTENTITDIMDQLSTSKSVELPTNFAYAHATLTVPSTTTSSSGRSNGSRTYIYNSYNTESSIEDNASASAPSTQTFDAPTIDPFTRTHEPFFDYTTIASGDSNSATHNNIQNSNIFEAVIKPTMHHNDNKVTLVRTKPTSFDDQPFLEQPANKMARYRNLVFPIKH